jgi:hypothetical protein
VASDAPSGGIQVLFGDQKQWSPPLGFGLPWVLKMFAHQPFYPNYIICRNVKIFTPKIPNDMKKIKNTYSFEIMRNIPFCDMKSSHFNYRHVLKLPMY